MDKCDQEHIGGLSQRSFRERLEVSTRARIEWVEECIEVDLRLLFK